MDNLWQQIDIINNLDGTQEVLVLNRYDADSDTHIRVAVTSSFYQNHVAINEGGSKFVHSQRNLERSNYGQNELPRNTCFKSEDLHKLEELQPFERVNASGGVDRFSTNQNQELMTTTEPVTVYQTKKHNGQLEASTIEGYPLLLKADMDYVFHCHGIYDGTNNHHMNVQVTSGVPLAVEANDNGTGQENDNDNITGVENEQPPQAVEANDNGTGQDNEQPQEPRLVEVIDNSTGQVNENDNIPQLEANDNDTGQDNEQPQEPRLVEVIDNSTGQVNENDNIPQLEAIDNGAGQVNDQPQEPRLVEVIDNTTGQVNDYDNIPQLEAIDNGAGQDNEQPQEPRLVEVIDNSGHEPQLEAIDNSTGQENDQDQDHVFSLEAANFI